MSLKEAKVRGDTAARTIASEPLASRQQLEAELSDAKLIGRLAQPERKSVLDSKALPRPLTPPQVPNIDLRGDGIEAPTPKRPKVATSKVPETPVPPAIAPVIKQAEAKDEDELDPELANLADDDLDIVEPSDEIEQVVALEDSAPDQDTDSGSTQVGDDSGGVADSANQPTGLFAALRAEVKEDDIEPAAESEPEAHPATEPEPLIDLTEERDAVIVDSAGQLERRLKRALADEQNELLAAIRGADKRTSVELIAVVGDADAHLARYVAAINEVAVVTYGAGAALIEADPHPGQLPAGAVEQLLSADVIGPLRQRLAELDGSGAESPGRTPGPDPGLLPPAQDRSPRRCGIESGPPAVCRRCL